MSRQDPQLADRMAIRELLENWVVWRDACEWNLFAGLWHSDGWMTATWFEASASDFIARSRAASKAGLRVVHSLGGSSIKVNETRAFSQTKMQIIQRASVDGIMVDVACHGRFYDAFEREEAEWKLLLRQPVYEMDRMTPVIPGRTPELDDTIMQRFPEGYRLLAYVQTKIGLAVNPNMPCANSAELATLIERARRWMETGTRTDLYHNFL